MIRRAGVLAPLFSLYSRQSLGIGEFADLKLLVDWCVKTGNSLIQLLPLNEMGPLSCPYDSISSFALEPAYISLRLLPAAKKDSMKEHLENLTKTFPANTPYADYRVKQEKLRILKGMFEQERPGQDADFKVFVKENHCWLDDFSLYKVIKEYQHGKPWYEWEERFKNHDPAALEQVKNEYRPGFLFQQWVQWRLYEQFKKIKAYAASKNVLMQGDLPILVSKDSADVWAHQEFFTLDFVAGAPPDMYCAKGQRWGMPPYNWHTIAAKKYRYIKERVRYAGHFYHMLRIDHVVGLFRIWCIPYNEPAENQGLNGFFEPSDERTWGAHGKVVLKQMMEHTSLAFCAEDLGVIPEICTKTLQALGIPGINVQRWTKDWHTTHDFLSPGEYRKLSVAALSTHDTPNWAAWWENEAGTVDEVGFMRMCQSREIDFNNVKQKLFDDALSKHGRLRWLDEVSSVEVLASVLGKPQSEIKDFIDAYRNTYREKEGLWKHLGCKGTMREKSDESVVRAALHSALKAASVYSIQLMIDWLYASRDIFPGDPYQYTINRPGTIDAHNWSLRLPLSLEEMLAHRVNTVIKKMITGAGRIPAVPQPRRLRKKQ